MANPATVVLHLLFLLASAKGPGCLTGSTSVRLLASPFRRCALQHFGVPATDRARRPPAPLPSAPAAAARRRCLLGPIAVRHRRFRLPKDPASSRPPLDPAVRSLLEMQWELVRDKLRRVVQRLPEEEQSPELHNLLRAMEAVAAARELLMEVEPPVQAPLQDGTCAISFDSRLLKVGSQKSGAVGARLASTCTHNRKEKVLSAARSIKPTAPCCVQGLALFLQSAALCLDAGAMVIPGDMGDRTFRLLLAVSEAWCC